MKPSNVIQKRRVGSPVKHSLELKISIARKVLEEHKSQSALAQETGLSVTNIHKWVGQARRGELVGYTAPSFDAETGDLAAENRRLKHALLEMTQQRDFLKKISAYFARGQS
jgi:transposase-like protein